VAIVAEEIGYRSPTDKEHFGFNDGVSQPRIEGNTPKIHPEDVNQTVKAGEFILGYPNQYNILPSTPVVPKAADPQNLLPSFPGNELPNFKDFGFNGTYLVYRKLAQHVAVFWQFMAQQGDSSPEIMKTIASKCVGRWPSGTPLVLSPEQDNPQLPDKNLFTYLPEDEKGMSCPVGAHIRRTNPRDSFLEVPPEQSLNTSNRHRILRRGALFGQPLYPLDDIENDRIPVDIQEDGQPRGLQFFCLNGDIGRQFEFVQQTWSNNPKFNGLYDNRDPIIGNNQGTSHMEIPQKPFRQRLLELPRFVTVKGGGYFFVPSLTAIKFIVS
jgi:Dyp-type peroxidase family